MRKLQTYMLKSFLGPFVFTFFISLFILLLQFLWKYLDDLVGKGLEWYIIAKLMFYASSTFVPLALPFLNLCSPCPASCHIIIIADDFWQSWRTLRTGCNEIGWDIASKSNETIGFPVNNIEFYRILFFKLCIARSEFKIRFTVV